MVSWVVLALVPCVVLAATGCDKVSKAFTRSTIPSLGPPLPYTVKLEFDPALTKNRLQYTNACNSPQELRVGEDLESTLLQAAHQTFKAVHFDAKTTPAGTKPDLEVRIGLLQSGLEIQTDGVYDRLPADLTLELGTVFRDATGKVVSEKNFPIRRQERLFLEPTQHRCLYVNSDSLVHDASVSLAIQFIKHARAILDPDGQYSAAAPGAQPGAPSAPEPLPMPVAPIVQAGPPVPANPGLSFKATVLDENSNAVLESGERVKVRVDLVNAGRIPVRDVAVTLTGTPALIGQFPATTLPVGLLQPGESRSIEFVATIPPAMPAQQARLHVAVTDASGSGGPPPQSFTTALQAGSAGTAATAGGDLVFIDVDQVPGAMADFQRPQTHLLAVGIGAYRDPLVPTRKFAAQDAELVASYFKTLGGVPAANVRVLQDRKALRPDMEEAILDWLPPRLTPDSVVIVYFAGQALVSPTGETFLLPYEGGTASTTRLYPLKDLQAALAKLNAQQVVLIFDGALLRLGKDAKTKAPQWNVGGGTLVRLIGATGFQPGLEPDQLKHGLFTYYLLRGLKGEADANHDGNVTLGELAAFVRQTVPAAAKSQFKQDQRPSVFPALTPSSKAASLPLARTAPRP